MARTQILPTDPGAVKVYSASVAVDVAKKSYFNAKMAGSETQKLPVLVKTDLESGAGDEVTCYLVAKLRGRPAQGSEKLEGREMRLSKYTDKLRVDKFRNGVNVGDVMDQKRVKWSLKSQARDRLSDYIAEFEDEMTMMHAAGARGVGAETPNLNCRFADDRVDWRSVIVVVPAAPLAMPLAPVVFAPARSVPTRFTPAGAVVGHDHRRGAHHYGRGVDRRGVDRSRRVDRARDDDPGERNADAYAHVNVRLGHARAQCQETPEECRCDGLVHNNAPLPP